MLLCYCSTVQVRAHERTVDSVKGLFFVRIVDSDKGGEGILTCQFK